MVESTEKELEERVNKLLKTMGISEKDLLKDLETAIISDLVYAIPRFSDKTLKHVASIIANELEKRTGILKKEVEDRRGSLK
jgi:hypothetical protein